VCLEAADGAVSGIDGGEAEPSGQLLRSPTVQHRSEHSLGRVATQPFGTVGMEPHHRGQSVVLVHPQPFPEIASDARYSHAMR